VEAKVKTKKRSVRKTYPIRLNQEQKDLLKIMGRVLLGVALGGITLTAVATSPFVLPKIIEIFLKKYPQYKNQQKDVERVAQKILKDRLVKIAEKNGKQYLEITNRGRREYLEYNIDTIKIKQHEHDGKWRVVIFDIPEKIRLARDVLRDKLKELGFKQIQKSVWVSPYECQNEISFIGSVYGVEQYINYFVAEKADFSESLKKTLGK
jgi:hypothetical protein